MENIKFKDLDLVGEELFRKINDSYIKSNLKRVMSTMFIAANKDFGVTDIKNEYYRKSGALPNLVYYIYTDQVDKNKTYDIVYLNGKKCIWFYIPNITDKIGEDYKNTDIIFDALFALYDTNLMVPGTFNTKEFQTVKLILSIRLIYFLHLSYGIIDIDKFKECYINENSIYYEKESIVKFINHIIDNYENSNYFDRKVYLESYILLKNKQ